MPLLLLGCAPTTTLPLAPTVLQAEQAMPDSSATGAASGDSPKPSTDAQPKLGTSAAGQAGLVISRGNSNTSTANAKFEVIVERRATKDDFEIEGLYGETSGISTAERWATTNQRNWNLTGAAFWFGSLHFEQDLFSGFAYQGNVSTGIGYKFIDDENTHLAAQLGAGYGRLRPEQLVKDASGAVIGRIAQDPQDEAVANGRVKFEHAFNSLTKLTEELSVVSGATNTLLENDLALQVKMNHSFSLSVGYTFRRNSSPPPGLVKNDELTTLNLVYQTGTKP